MESLFTSAAWALKYGGDFFLVHRPERLAQLCACASRNQMEVKRLLLLRHRQDGPVSLILAQCRKGGKPGLILEEAALQDMNGLVRSAQTVLTELESFTSALLPTLFAAVAATPSA